MDLAQTVLHDIQYLRSHYYYFLGKIESWGDSDFAPNVAQTDSISENLLIRSNALLFKKINQNDASLVCKRYDWTTGVIYDKWDHTLDMSDKTFYVMNSTYNVYKCLDNNGGIASTVEPTGTPFRYFKTADGYTWKYMYTIPSFKRTKFLTFDQMPVQKALSDSFYSKGAVEDVAIVNGGTGYTDTLLTYITLSNPSVGSGATATLTTNPLTGAITGVTIGSGGSGYTKGAKISVASVTGSGAVLELVIAAGVVTSVNIIDGGVGYENTDVVSITVGGAILVPMISRDTGQIVDVSIVDAGAGYTSAPVVTVAVAVGQVAGTGLYTGNATALIETVVDEGKIVRVLIRDPGKDYPVDTATTITVSGDGTGASFSPVVYQGSIIDVVIENAGTGYTNIQLDVIGSGTGAVVNGITTVSDYQSDQTIVEQTTIPGAIYSIEVTNPGSFYTFDTTVSITGDGTGATATVYIVDGMVSKVLIDNPGSGYTYANLTFTDPNRLSAPVEAVDAAGYAILPPRGGHGFSAIDELFGNTLAINSLIKLENGLETLDIEQEFRQYGIIKSPTHASSGTLYKEDNNMIVYVVKVGDVTGLVEDEILLQDNVKFRVVSFDTFENTIVLQKLGAVNVTITSLVAQGNPNRIYGVQSLISYPRVDKYSGRMLYVSNENPFIISGGQSIAVKTFLKL